MRAINLIPADEREGAGSVTGRSGGAALLVLALIGGLALLAFLYGKAQHTASSARSELASVESEVSAARAQVARLTPYTSFISMADQRAQEISQLVASRFDWSHAFNELGRVVPHTAVLTSLHGQVGSATGGSSGSAGAGSATAGSAGAAPTATSSTPPGSTPSFQLSGCATTQSEVANTLQRLRLIDGAAEVTLQTSAKGSASSGTGAPGQASSAGPCPNGSPTFSATVTFNPLPAPPPAPSAAAIVPTPVSAPAQPRSQRRINVSTKPGGSR